MWPPYLAKSPRMLLAELMAGSVIAAHAGAAGPGLMRKWSSYVCGIPMSLLLISPRILAALFICSTTRPNSSASEKRQPSSRVHCPAV